ncbi:unnamed protein product [Ixodes pacificus]
MDPLYNLGFLRVDSAPSPTNVNASLNNEERQSLNDVIFAPTFVETLRLPQRPQQNSFPSHVICIHRSTGSAASVHWAGWQCSKRHQAHVPRKGAGHFRKLVN